MTYADAAGTALDLTLKTLSVFNGIRAFIPKKDSASSGGGSDTPQKKAAADQDGADADHPPSDGGAAPQESPKTLDVSACVSVLFPQDDNAPVCGGVQALPANIIQEFDVLAAALKDKAAIEDDPEIKPELGPVAEACDCILQDIKEADESEEKTFPVSTMSDVHKAEDSAAGLHSWAKRIVSDKLGSQEAKTKQARLQIVPYILALAYAARIRVIAHLVKRDMTSQESDKEGYLDQACRTVDDLVALLHKAVEGLMPNTSLLEIALDYELPMALYLTLMMRFRASVDAIQSPDTKPGGALAFDDGLASIRKALHWNPSGSGAQAHARAIDLNSIEESVWWAKFTDTDLRAADTNMLRARITIRELSHVLGARSAGIANTLALQPGQKSALTQLPPASALRDALRDAITRTCGAAPPHSFARISAPLPPLDALRQGWLGWLSWFWRPICPPTIEKPLIAAAPRTLCGHSQPVLGVAVCPDGDRVLSGSWDGTERVWSLSSGQTLRIFSEHTDKVNCVAVSPDGKTAVSGSWSNSARVWNLENESEIESESDQPSLLLQSHSHRVWGVAVSPDGLSIASGSEDMTVKLWNAESGVCQGTLSEHRDYVLCVAFSPDGSSVVSGSLDGSIRVCNVRTRAIGRSPHGHASGVYGVAVMPDERRIVSGSADRTVRVWSLSSGAEEMCFKGHTGYVDCVAVFPDGERIASGSRDKSIRVWNVRSQALELTLTGHTGWVRCISVAPDGRSVVSGSDDKTIKVWALSDGDDDDEGVAG